MSGRFHLNTHLLGGKSMSEFNQNTMATLGAGNVYFFNMINQSVTVLVNNYVQAASTLAGLGGYPYTAAGSSAFARVNTQAQANQFGPTNAITIQVSGGGSVSLNINVSSSENLANDILIFVYNNGVSAMAINEFNSSQAGWASTLTIGSISLV
jgi:hypothetical protein